MNKNLKLDTMMKNLNNLFNQIKKCEEPGMKQLWSNCDLFVGVGVGLLLGSAIGSVIALIVCP